MSAVPLIVWGALTAVVLIVGLVLAVMLRDALPATVAFIVAAVMLAHVWMLGHALIDVSTPGGCRYLHASGCFVDVKR